MIPKIPDWEQTRNCYFCKFCEPVEKVVQKKGMVTSYRYKCHAHKVEIKEIGYCSKFKRSGKDGKN